VALFILILKQSLTWLNFIITNKFTLQRTKKMAMSCVNIRRGQWSGGGRRIPPLRKRTSCYSLISIPDLHTGMPSCQDGCKPTCISDDENYGSNDDEHLNAVATLTLSDSRNIYCTRRETRCTGNMGVFLRKLRVSTAIKSRQNEVYRTFLMNCMN
jgi:hypothetical protein